MRAASQLIAEMDLWQLAWQQVETFVDRVDGARDQDAAAAARFIALMTAAAVVERARASRIEDSPLGDPVADTPPLPDLETGWRSDHRVWRVPGADELELAVGNLYEEPGDGDDPVELLPPSDFFTYIVEPGDRQFPQSDDGVVTVRMPSYSGLGTVTIAGVALEAAANPIGLRKLTPDIKEDGDIVSLFSPDNRGNAATDIDQTDQWVQSWSDLTARRRDNRRSANPADVNFYSASGAQVAWTLSLGLAAIMLASDARLNRPPSSGRPGLTIVREVAEAAEGAAAVVGGDGELLRQAADSLEEVGVADPDLPGMLRQAADSFGGRPELFAAVAGAARALEAFLVLPLGLPVPNAQFQHDRSAAADRLEETVSALNAMMTASKGPLFDSPIEDGPMTTEINDTVAARIAYPDGSLRILRALEAAFVRFWPARIRWFNGRHALLLATVFQRFQAPFHAGLRALVRGGDTGFPAQGLTVLAAAPIRATKLRLDQPASLAFALEDVEAGHVALLNQGRRAAVLVLGMTGDHGRLALEIAPLRVSIAPADGAAPDDTPGQITGGQPLETFMPGSGLSNAALRLGEHPTDPRADGPVETAVILYGQLSLLFGWEQVERGIGTGIPDYGSRSLEDPSDAPVESLILYGTAPGHATTLVIKGAGEAFWDRSVPADPLPRLARPGEYLLLRGRSAGEGGETGPLRQSVVEVESVYATSAKNFHRMDANAAALLSTTPLPSHDIDACLADCEPEEHLIVMVLARSWQSQALVADITIRRDFEGFDLPSLATGKLLPASVVRSVTGNDPPGPADVDRRAEFTAAKGILADWTRFARR